MDQNVSESRNRLPVNLGMTCFQMLADPLSGLGQGLEITQYGVLNQLRLAKNILSVLAIPLNAVDAVDDVTDVEAILFHNGIASWSTRSRING